MHIVTPLPLLLVGLAMAPPHRKPEGMEPRNGAHWTQPLGQTAGQKGSLEGQWRVASTGCVALWTLSISYPQWRTLGRGDSGQRELPSVKQVEGQDTHPISGLLVGPAVLRRPQVAPSASPGDQCAHSPICSIPSSSGVFTIPARSSHCLFPCGRPSGTRPPTPPNHIQE